MFIPEKKIERKEKMIVVGGGTAGLVAARRLSSMYDVEVFERSKFKSLPLLNRIPLMVGLLFRKSNRYIEKVELQGPGNRKVPFFVSNVLGGSSAMNGCVHVFGDKKIWSKILRKFCIDEEDLDASYQELFSKKPNGHGMSLDVAPAAKIDLAFVDALAGKGIRKGETEFADAPNVGPIVNTVHRFFRSSVLSLLKAKKFKIRLETKVDCLAIDGDRRVVGVVSNGKIFPASRVTLCAGVAGTNELLMTKALDVSSGQLVDLQLPVGYGITDHVNLRIDVTAPFPINSLNEIASSFLKKTLVLVGYMLGKRNLMMGTGATSAGNLDLDGDGIVDTRINLLRFYESGRTGAGLFSSFDPGFAISITMINPHSRGKAEYKNGNVTITPGYLNDDNDVDFLQKAVLFCLDLLNTEHMSPYVKEIIFHEEIRNNIKSFIKKHSFSGYHLRGGCADLVDSDFSVKSMSGLYICDASILDEFPASNIHAPVVILADLFSKKFLLQ